MLLESATQLYIIHNLSFKTFYNCDVCPIIDNALRSRGTFGWERIVSFDDEFIIFNLKLLKMFCLMWTTIFCLMNSLIL